MMKHKWHKEIKAWADGAEIEEFSYGVWEKRDQPRWHLNYQYRIFRKPKEYTKEEIAQWKWSNEGEIREKTK